MATYCSRRRKRSLCSWEIQDVGRAAVAMTAALACVLQPTYSFVSIGAPDAFQRMSSSSHAIDTIPLAIVNDEGLASERRRRPGAVHAGEASSLQTQPTVSEAEAKHELLDLLSQPATAEVKERVPFLVEALQGSFIPIQTVGFFNLAAQVSIVSVDGATGYAQRMLVVVQSMLPRNVLVQSAPRGKWHFAYTDSKMPPIGPRLTILEHFQQIDPGEENEGSLDNVIVWRLDDEQVSGRLEVKCKYALNPRGFLDVSLGEHLLRADDSMPRDPEELVRLLQRAMPYEMFDPDEHTLETCYMDDSVRVLRIRGPKHEGRLNIFVRDRSALSSASGVGVAGKEVGQEQATTTA